MSRLRRTTDYGTVGLHAVLVAMFVWLTATGLRIATDDPETAWLAVLDPLLPSEHLWYRHLVAGATLTAALAAYARYMSKARLGARVRLDAARLLAITRPGPNRWSALNVVVYWLLMTSLVAEIASGIALFAGAGRSILAVHRDVTFVCLACVTAHVGLHAAFGGRAQLLRVLRPARLVMAPPPPDLAALLAEQLGKQQLAQEPPPASSVDAKARKEPPSLASTKLRAHPVVSALIVAAVVIAAAVEAERETRETLRDVELKGIAPPRLDGDLSDLAWTIAKPVRVLTSQGGDFGGQGQSVVEIRAVHDGDFAYFAFVWEDPTRSLKHMPLVKRQGHWQVAASRSDLRDEEHFNEDKFAVLLTPPGLPLIGGAIHLADRPVADHPSSASGRGLHYTTDGSYADIWLWRASHGGVIGHIDNCHFGGPSTPLDQASGPAAAYSGGFACDARDLSYTSNLTAGRDEAGRAMVLPRSLPRDPVALVQALGLVRDGHGISDGEHARWWMTTRETIPYSAAADAHIPDGTIMPSVIVAEQVPITRTSIRGVARWAAGRWTLELARRLYTGSATDVSLKTGVMLWVAAFDHADKRHTRHLRPFKLEVE